MQDLWLWLARAKGIEVEPGAELRFEFASFPTGGLALLALLGALLAVGIVVRFYRRDRAKLTVGQRTILAVLRALTVIVVLLLVFEPDLVAVRREVRPGHAIVLVDTSQSMAHVDAYRRESTRDLAAAWNRLGVADPAAVPRLDLAKALLRHEDHAALRQLALHNRVHLYGFHAGIEPMPLLPVPVDPSAAPVDPASEPAPIPDLAAVSADGRHSNLGQAVRAALERSRDAAIAGVIVLSDGRRNLGPQGEEIARLLGQRKVAHTLVVPIGDPAEAQFVSLRRIEAPEKVFQRDPFRISAEVQAQGYGELELTLRLLAGLQGGPAQPVQAKTVRLTPSAPAASVTFADISAAAPGTIDYTVEILPPPGEPANADRHTRRARVQVLAEQTRVLLLAGGPSPEFRILRDTLMRDKTIDVSCWLQSADEAFPQDGNTRIEELPRTREALAKFDVFILLDPDARKLSPEFAQLVRRQIDEDGAGMWWVAGEKFTLPAARPEAPLHALAELLPVELDLRTADQTSGLGYAYDTAWPWVLTPQGAFHPLALVVDGKEESKLMWERLPGFFWSFPVAGLKPAAQPVVTHGSPRLRQTDGKEMTLIAGQTVGTGRVLYSGTDETYRWRGIHRPAYERFWVKGIRWLFEGRLRAGGARTRIHLSAERVELGETVRIEVDARDEKLEPLLEPGVMLKVVREGGLEESLSCAPVQGVPGRYEATLRATSLGFHRIEGAFGASAVLQVARAAVESEGPVDLTTLNGIAGTEGGRLLASPGDLLEAVRAIPSFSTTDVFRTPYPIWDTWATVAVLTLLLAAEWWLRKRFNLL